MFPSSASASAHSGQHRELADHSAGFTWPWGSKSSLAATWQGSHWAQSWWAKWAVGLLVCSLLASIALSRNLSRRSAELERELQEVVRGNAASAARIKELDSQLARRFEVERDMSEKVKRHSRASDERRKVLATELSELEGHLTERDQSLQRKLADEGAALQESQSKAGRLSEELSMERYHSSTLEKKLADEKKLGVELKAQLDTLQAELSSRNSTLQARAESAESELQKERSAAAQREAVLDYQKRSTEALGMEVARQKRAVSEQKEMRAVDIKTALDRLQAAEVTNKALTAKLANFSQASVGMASMYDEKIQELHDEAQRAREASQKALQAQAAKQEEVHESDLRTIAELEVQLHNQQAQQPQLVPGHSAPIAAAKVPSLSPQPQVQHGSLQEESSPQEGTLEQVDQVQRLRDELAELEASDLRIGRKRARQPVLSH